MHTVTYDEQPPPPDDPHYGNVTPLHPHTNTEAEHGLIGVILAEPDYAADLYHLVNSDDFDDHGCELTWDAIGHVLADGLAPEPQLVIGQLRKTGNLDKARPHRFVANGATSTNAHWYAQTITTNAAMRRVAARVTKAHQIMGRPSTTPEQAATTLADAMDAMDGSLTTLWGGRTRADDGPAYTDFTGIFSRPKIPTPWVIAPVLAAGRITLLYSPGKTGKSLIAMEAAAAIATGRPALATDQPGQPQHVLYIDQEMTEEDWADRLRDMGYTTTDEQLLAEHLHLAQLHAWPPMDTPAGGQAVAAAVKATGATTVIIDTASKVIAGEENSNDTQQQFYRSTLIPLKREGLAVLVLDHTGKDLERGARGGSAKTDNIDLAFELVKRGRDTLTMRCTHARFRDELLEEPTLLRRDTDPLRHELEHLGLSSEAEGATRPTFLMERVSKYVEANPGQSKTAIETAVKGKAEYVRLALEVLVAEQYVEVRRASRNTMTHHSIRRFEQEGEADD